MTLLPGTWGVCHGHGPLGYAIRAAELDMSGGDAEASWAGHAFVYAGDGRIVQAEWPEVILSPVTAHADARWATGQPLTDVQRHQGVQAVRGLLGKKYDWLSYLYFMARVARVTLTRDLRPLFTAEAKTGPICSGVVVRELSAMGVPLGELRTAAIQDPDFVSPADLLRYGLDNSWMDKKVPL